MRAQLRDRALRELDCIVVEDDATLAELKGDAVIRGNGVTKPNGMLNTALSSSLQPETLLGYPVEIWEQMDAVAANAQLRRRAWLGIYVVRCAFPCDPPVGSHSCNGGMIPHFHRPVCD
jgi:predicted phage gp36 major capsid-like protein